MNKILTKIRNRFNHIVSDRFSHHFSGSYFMSSFYYMFLSPSFRREMFSVLNGKVKHIKDSGNENKSFYTLIRNTHRLEKGLLMRPRRDVFAVDFIKETVDHFQALFSADKCSFGTQLKWSYDVITEYFDVIGQHPIVDTQKARFKTTVSNFEVATNVKKSIPYFRYIENKPNISFDDFYNLTKFRRSVRWFLQKPVPRELVDKAILAANQSPSACNRQPFEFRIIDEENLLKEVVNIPMGIKGYQNNVPMIVVAVGNLDAYFDERDRHVIYVDSSLANMTFMLALETLGLSSCPINWPDIEHLERRMEKALGLKKHQRPIMCIAVGFPDPEGMVAFSEKRGIEEIRKYN